VLEKLAFHCAYKQSLFENISKEEKWQGKNELAKIVGERNVSDAQEVLLKYSSDHSLVPPGMPECVVFPTSSEQVSEVVKWCNKNNVPAVPVSSQVHFNGGAIPNRVASSLTCPG